MLLAIGLLLFVGFKYLIANLHKGALSISRIVLGGVHDLRELNLYQIHVEVWVVAVGLVRFVNVAEGVCIWLLFLFHLLCFNTIPLQYPPYHSQANIMVYAINIYLS